MESLSQDTQAGCILLVMSPAKRRSHLREVLDTLGYSVVECADGFGALECLAQSQPDLVLADYDVSGLWGRRLLQKIKRWDPDTAVIFMAERCSWQDAVRAVKEGASDFLRRPIDTQDLQRSVANALERRRSHLSQKTSRQRDADEDAEMGGLVGTSLPMQALYRAITQVAPSRASVLICGESGTGKELVARAIHQQGNRQDGPFVGLNCAALAQSLLESELFGHEKGAFTGAARKRRGRFEQGDGGTVFLDEVGEIPLATQVKLLRFLQERTFQRVGGNKTIKVDVRILAATNQDLAQLVEQGRFREDLYYRLNVISIYVPALREKVDDIPILAMHFLKTFGRENNKNIVGFTDRAMSRIMSHSWPGNVRELENTVERAVVLAQGPQIDEQHLPPTWQDPHHETGPPIPGASLAAIERYAILKTLEMTAGSTAKAAHILGISKRKIQYKLKEYRAE
jgi:DNA-binding NtrC family response regulator